MWVSANRSPALCFGSGTDLHSVGVWGPGASAPVLVGGARQLSLECSLAVTWPLASEPGPLRASMSYIGSTCRGLSNS